jgi:hypothetical protein
MPALILSATDPRGRRLIGLGSRLEPIERHRQGPRGGGRNPACAGIAVHDGRAVARRAGEPMATAPRGSGSAQPIRRRLLQRRFASPALFLVSLEPLGSSDRAQEVRPIQKGTITRRLLRFRALSRRGSCGPNDRQVPGCREVVRLDCSDQQSDRARRRSGDRLLRAVTSDPRQRQWPS